MSTSSSPNPTPAHEREIPTPEQIAELDPTVTERRIDLLKKVSQMQTNEAKLTRTTEARRAVLTEKLAHGVKVQAALEAGLDLRKKQDEAKAAEAARAAAEADNNP